MGRQMNTGGSPDAEATRRRRDLEAALRRRAGERPDEQSTAGGWRQREVGAKSAKSPWQRKS